MRKILGLDLGVTSIGWAYIKEDDGESEILGLGTRIIKLETDEKDEFNKGNKISKNQQRTLKRTLRKGYDRYQLRKRYLREELKNNSMLPDAKHFSLSAIELYGLRNKAVQENQIIDLKDLGRILLHLNQKRGYKSSKKETAPDEKNTDYVQVINNRYDEIQKDNITVGQYFYQGLLKDERFRIKELVFPRHAYIEEFDKIWAVQKKYYPTVLTDTLYSRLRNEVIYYQRPLKSQKGLVSTCEFEGTYYTTKEGKEVFAGPKVAPKSSPLFQVCKIWESINNISIKNRRGEEFEISPEKKHEIFTHLDNNDKLTQTELFRILDIGKNDGYYANVLIKKKGLQGNLTKSELIKAFDGHEMAEKFLAFNLRFEELPSAVDPETGEIVQRKIIKSDFENQPLYKLWHIIYSIPEERDIISTLKTEYGLNDEIAGHLAKIDFSKGGFGNKSARAIRKILPYLQEGCGYSLACLYAGYNHSDSLTKEENIARKLSDTLKLLPKNSLRQPVVEKILNQLINLVNALMSNPKYGRPDEIRVELARELKQSREERNETFSRINEAESYHNKIRKLLLENPEFQKQKVTRKDIERYKLWEEFGNKSPYEPNKCIGIGELFNGNYDVEHIIPKSRLFDDSFSNKTICPRQLNSGENAKNQMTAFDFMQTRGDEKFHSFLEVIDAAYNKGYNGKKISKAKRDKLLMSLDKIPNDFISRQLTETRYISRKAREILTQVCRNVWTTNGSITNYLRHQWGWDDVLIKLNWDKYPDEKKHTEIRDGRTRYIIEDWTKRDDHRHHAIDALTIACTTQGIIKRLNDLNKVVEVKQNQTQQQALKESDGDGLKSHIDKIKPFTTKQIEESASKILTSYKTGKKVATYGKRTIRKHGKKVVVQDKIIVPRGALSKESTYGKIMLNGKEEYVIKYKLGAGAGYLFESKEKEKIKKILASIVDGGVRAVIQRRLEASDYNLKDAFKEPVWMNEEKKIPIKTVRCKTGGGVLESIKVKDTGNNIEYEKYVTPGNNHHLAIYTNEKGKKIDHISTLWHAVERKKYGIPIIITNPQETWDAINARKDELPDSFLKKLPGHTWKYEISMQENELFVFDMPADEIQSCINNNDSKAISDRLYRFQKTESGYKAVFRHHLATTLDKKIDWKGFASFSAFNGIKVRLNPLGEIIKIGE